MGTNHHLRKGVRAYHKGQLQKAKAEFRRAIVADDSLGAAHNNLGLVQYELGDFYNAAWSFQRAIERMPEDPQPLYNLGLTYEENEKYEEALGLYLQAYALCPSDPQYLGNALRTRRKLGEPAAAMLPELQELLTVEDRPEWRDWIREQIHYQSIHQDPVHTQRTIRDDDVHAQRNELVDPADNLLRMEGLPHPMPLTPPTPAAISDAP